MSFDLAVVAIDGWTDVAEVGAMVDRCQGLVHVDGELDERIVAFYERLRARFPDYPPHPDDCPWMSMPLDVGIDHVFMCLSYGERSDPAITLHHGAGNRARPDSLGPAGRVGVQAGDRTLPRGGHGMVA